MKKGKAKKATQAVKSKSSAPVINKDITETIRVSYQAELRSQTQALQNLKKTLKTVTAQLAKATTKRRVLKKKKMTVAKKVGTNPRGADKKLNEQAKKDYQAVIDESAMLQKSAECARQDFKLVKEQVRKLSAIIRAIQKMEKAWDKAIAAKFRAKPKKRTVAKKKKAAVAAAEAASAPVAAATRRSRPAKPAKPTKIVEVQPALEEVSLDS